MLRKKKVTSQKTEVRRKFEARSQKSRVAAAVVDSGALIACNLTWYEGEPTAGSSRDPVRRSQPRTLWKLSERVTRAPAAFRIANDHAVLNKLLDVAQCRVV
jgi:hypothetical protein